MKRAYIKDVIHAPADLTTFGAVVGISECGAIYRHDSDKAVRRIIAICNKEMQRLVKIHDAAVAAVKAEGRR